MKVERAMHLALADNFTPTPHQQAGASYVLAKEVERLQAIVDNYPKCWRLDENGKRLQRDIKQIADWLNETFGPNLDDWPEVYWWIREAAEAAKGEAT